MYILDFFKRTWRWSFKRLPRLAPLGLLVCLILPSTVASDVIGSVDTVFKLLTRDDDIVIEAFDDEDVPGVTCYLSRARKGGLKGMMGVAEDSSDASIECIRTGPITVPDDIRSGKRDGEKVFKKGTSLIFKSMQVVRFYDKDRDALVYLVYSDKLVDGSPKNSLTVVKVP